MSTAKLDQLIVENLADLDAAAKRIGDIERRVWRAIGDAVEDWAKARDWACGADDDDVWVSPRGWLVEGEPMAWFGLDWGPKDDDDGGPDAPHFALSRLAGVAGGRLCLWLDYAGIGVRPWKAALAGNEQAVALSGFSLSDSQNAFIDATPGSGTLATGLAEGDLEPALAPVMSALDQAFEASKLFDAILKTARG